MDLLYANVGQTNSQDEPAHTTLGIRLDLGPSGLELDLSVLLEFRPDISHACQRLPVCDRRHIRSRSDGRKPDGHYAPPNTILGHGLELDLSVLLEPRPELNRKGYRLPVCDRRHTNCRSDGRKPNNQAAQRITDLGHRLELIHGFDLEHCPGHSANIGRDHEIDLCVPFEPRHNHIQANWRLPVCDQRHPSSRSDGRTANSISA